MPSAAPARSRPALGAHLDTLLARTDRLARRDTDPVSFAHHYTAADDREVVALLAASVAFGNVKAIRASIARALDALGASPAATIDRESERALAGRLRGFVHRVYRGEDLARMLAGAARIRRAHGSLAAALPLLAAPGGSDAPSVPPFLASRAPLVRVLAGLGDALRGPGPSRPGLAHLVPDVRRGSACKRLLLFLRWMCRPDDGVDLGLSRFPASELVIPLDTHVHRIALNLGLTRRRDASLRTAVEITDALARFDPSDPVKYDFAICHLGISGACPSRRDATQCAPCHLRPVCRHWSRGRALRVVAR